MGARRASIPARPVPPGSMAVAAIRWLAAFCRPACRAPRLSEQDVFRAEVGAALSAAQRRVMTAIEQCRTAALGGHVEQRDRCTCRTAATVGITGEPFAG